MGHYSPYALCARPTHLRNVSAGSEQVTILKRMGPHYELSRNDCIFGNDEHVVLCGSQYTF